MYLLDIIAQPRNITNKDWVLYTLLGVLFFIGISKQLFYDNFKNLKKYKTYMDLYSSNTISFNFIIKFIFLVLISLLLAPYVKFDDPFLANDDFFKFLLVFACFSVFNIFKLGLELLYHYAFYSENNYDLYIRNSNFIKVRGVIVLLIAVILYYYSDLNKEYLLMTWVTLLIINRIYELYRRNLLENKTQAVKWYYNILYLCALEVLPVMVLFKLLNG